MTLSPTPEHVPAGGPELWQVRRVGTAVPGPRSQVLLERQKAALPAGVGSALPVFIAAAGGGVVVDVDDNAFIDFGSGIGVTTVGNSASRVVQRASDQLSRFTHTCFLVNPYQSYVEVCEQLNSIVPIDGPARTVLFNTGSEAVENAVKVARAVTGRSGIVSFDHAYHGRTLLTMTLTAKNRPYRHGFGPFAPEVYRTPMAYPYRWPSGPGNSAAEAAEMLTDLLDRQLGADSVAAVIVEPIQGEGGFVVPAPGFLATVAGICRSRGVLLIADEVQAGLARTGDWFASQHEGIQPDMVTMAKGLGGGLPIAALTGRADIMDAAPAGGLGGTFSGNPVACEAALGVFEEIQLHDLRGRAREIGTTMRTALEAFQAKHDVIGDVRGRGAMQAIEIVKGGGDNTPDADLTGRIARRCHQDGLLALTAGSWGNVLRFLPPLSMPQELLNEGLEVLGAAITAEVAVTRKQSRCPAPGEVAGQTQPAC